MKQFAKMVLAGIVGLGIYDLVDYTLSEVLRRHNAKLRERSCADIPPQKDRKRETYSPEISGRRTIGFKMQGEE